MTDIVTVKLDVQNKPDIQYSCDFALTPQVITLIYRLDLPDPSPEGIHPIRAEVEGRAYKLRPTSMGMDRNRRCRWFYRAHPEFWPDWLIQLGAEYRPQRGA
ncbi:hypothetical protein ACF08W_22495 [Streptomyces sp. NPDC015144]|uniref:hypothetical protein n=1 Tax=Streptomyces sp. NPDC015144 TaxID=3364944 RepID=UPI0036FD4B84